MKVKSINFLSPLENIYDIFDYNMDVSVNLGNGQNYVVVVGTPKNLLKLMENEKIARTVIEVPKEASKP